MRNRWSRNCSICLRHQHKCLATYSSLCWAARHSSRANAMTTPDRPLPTAFGMLLAPRFATASPLSPQDPATTPSLTSTSFRTENRSAAWLLRGPSAAYVGGSLKGDIREPMCARSTCGRRVSGGAAAGLGRAGAVPTVSRRGSRGRCSCRRRSAAGGTAASGIAKSADPQSPERSAAHLAARAR